MTLNTHVLHVKADYNRFRLFAHIQSFYLLEKVMKTFGIYTSMHAVLHSLLLKTLCH
jgi:hypothetical protein